MAREEKLNTDVSLKDAGFFASVRAAPWLMYGLCLLAVGAGMYFVGVCLSVPRYLLGMEATLRPLAEWLVWYSGAPVFLGLAFALADVLLFFEDKRAPRFYRDDVMKDAKVTVALTAYNDEESIAAAVRDFTTHPRVEKVIVVSNNSSDNTMTEAQAAGAIVFNEQTPGYGACVYRCYKEALAGGEASLIVLCEGDRTFRAADIDKFVAYAPHADIVNGTRIVEMLRARSTQLTTFMFYGNLFVAKLLEAKHLGRSTLTDMGTTYKLVRREALERLMPHLDPSVNLEFNAHFMDVALKQNFSLIECPITFHSRVGVSKGGNVSNRRATKVGLAMMRGVMLGWK
ncbi:MAG: glycosyltransferase [Pseudomonadota bacterium]